MRPRHIRSVCAMLAVGAWACAKDPTASLRNGPASLSITPRQMFPDTGVVVALVVVPRDAQLNPLAVAVTVTSADTTIAKVATDSNRPNLDSATYAFLVSARSPGRTKLTVSGGGLTDSVTVSVLPLLFTGAISDTAPQGGALITISATPVLKFNPAKVTVTFAGGHVGTIVSATAEAVQVLVPFSDRGQLTIDSILPNYVAGLELSLPTSAVVHQVGDRWAADNSWQTAPDITAMLPASGQSAYILSGTAPDNVAVCPEGVLGFGSSGPCMMFSFTLAAPTTLNFTTNWEGAADNPDIDVYACSDSTVANFGAACFEDGGAGATGAKPQSTGAHTYPAGTHYFVIETFAGSPSKNLYTKISRP